MVRTFKQWGEVQVISQGDKIKCFVINGIKVDIVDYECTWIDEVVTEECLRLASPSKGLFDHVFVSHEVHLAKPDPAKYHHAVRVIGRPAEQCLFIDDTLLNVEAANREGLHGAWLDIQQPDALKIILAKYL